jgi:putative nucleotidyltransferase with HDIG domain
MKKLWRLWGHKMTGKLPISREEAIELLKSMPQEESDWNHYLESEAIMRSLAEKLGEDVEYWGMLGLLHDVDWALTKNDWTGHCTKAVEILKEKGFDDEFIETVQSHGYGYDEIPSLKEKKRTKKVEHAKKKFKDKRFAENCDRELMREIEQVGLSLDEFFEISIEALKKIKDEIGLE